MKKHIKVAAALIFDNGKLLATKRGESPFPYVAHKYEFAGGKIEAGETDEQCIIRECQEELGITLSVAQKLTDKIGRASCRERVCLSV